jgi:hypothetical protein
MLIVSFILVVVLIIAAMLAGRGDRDGDRGGGFDFDFFDFMILRDLLWWGSYSSYPAYVDYSRPATTKASGKGNFLTKCFSFLFGDGDPNAHLEERKWQVVAQLIRSNGGVVTAEQLAPYTGADPKNEDEVLPVLVRFNGSPEVTDEGFILYSFPSLQVTASGYGMSGSLPSYLREFKREFSVYDNEELTGVFLLATANLFGSWWLWGQSMRMSVLIPFHGLVNWLVLYGTFFVAVPFFRWLAYSYINSRIESRNNKREKNALYLKNASSTSSELVKKLGTASKLRQSKLLEAKPSSQVVYSTDKDILEQEFDEGFSK